MLVDTAAGKLAGLSDEERTAIQEQVGRLLANSHFSQSRRFPSFLRYVVEKTLASQEDALKERTLGVEIFGRPADYDTASDPIVRVTAAEIRKRIAQYYQEPGHEVEIRVSLPAGSYVPQFHWPQTTITTAGPDPAVALPEVLAPIAAADPVPDDPRRSRKYLWMRISAPLVALVCVALGGVWSLRSVQRSAFDFFWEPVLNSSDSVLFCIADQNQYTAIALRDAADPTHQTILKDNLSAVVIDDLSTVVKIAGVLQAHGTKYSLKGEGSTNLSDLRNGPTVFVGAFDNAWTLRLTKPLRFHFGNNADMTRFWIADSNNPDRIDWVIDRPKQQATNNYRDYAIVAQFTDSTTGKIAIVAAGVGRGGTIAAGEFLIDTAHLTQILNAVRASGGKKNMEFVLSTEIIDGQPGTPKMEAAYFW